MSNAPSSTSGSPAATPPPAVTSKGTSRLRRDQGSLLVDAKATAAAVKANLDAFVQADAGRAVKRVDASWLSRYTAMITAAETAIDGRAVRFGELRAVTATERENATTLADALRGIRDDISTSYPGDAGIGRAFGVGAAIDPKRTSGLLQLAGEFAEAFASKQWSARAAAAGVTEARIDAINAVRAALSGADVSQQGLYATNVDGTVEKDALLKAVSGSTAYARKVAAAVLKSNPTALASFVPARARAPKKEKAKKSAATATTTATSNASKRKKASPGKLRARRAQVKARAKTLAAGPTVTTKAAKAAKKKSAAKKTAAKKRAKK